MGRAPCGEDRCWLGVPAGVSSVAPRCSLDCSTAAVRTDTTSGAPAEEDEEMGGEPSQRSKNICELTKCESSQHNNLMTLSKLSSSKWVHLFIETQHFPHEHLVTEETVF